MFPAASILPASEADLPELSDLISSLFILEPDFAPNEARQIAGLRLQLEDQARSRVFKAVEADRVVGMLTVQLLASTAEGGWSGLLEDVVVAESHRGQGVGKALVKAAEAWAMGKGATRMQLLADRENAPALAFYDHLGYGATRMICRRKKLR